LSRHAHKSTAETNADSRLRPREQAARDKHADPARMDVRMLQSSGGNRAVNALLGAGAPLEPRVRSDMEARFRADFGDVRIHDDPAAHDAAAGIGAKAYTLGEDIVFSDGRLAPGTSDGRKLLAHELAHVVQQRRGGAMPALDAAGSHEQGATAAAEQAASGAASVQVAGATSVGIARDAEDDPRRRKGAGGKAGKAKTGAGPGKAKKSTSKATASGSAANFYLDSPFKSSLDEDEYNPAIRKLSPGAEYWLNHVADPASLPWSTLVDEANQIDEWLSRQTSTSRESMRMEQIRDAFRREAASQAKKQGKPAKPAKPTKKAKAKGKGGPAKVSTEPPEVDQRPRALREQSSIDTSDPDVLQREYDEIMAYLQRKDVPAADRKALQVELATLTPQLDQVLGQRAQFRHAEEINRAIMPSKGSGDGLEDLKTIAANIDNIKPLADQPGFSYVMRGGEMVVMHDEEAAAIRAQMSANLEKSRVSVHNAIEQVHADWQETWKLNYEDHPGVGFLVSAWSGDDTMDLQAKYMPHVANSNVALGRYEQLKKSSASFKDQAESIATAAKAGAEARITYDEGVGRQIQYAGKWVGVLSKAKAAGQLAANIAAPGLGGALYAGGEEVLVQGVEIHYGQRDNFDFGAIAIDAASNYVAGKVTTGILSLPGKGAGLFTRGATWVAADRAGSVAGAWTHMGLEQATGRSHYSASEYFHTGWNEATDWKQTIVNAGVGGLAHYAHGKRPGRAGEESARERPGTPPKPAAEPKTKVEKTRPKAERAKPTAEEAKPITEKAKPKVAERESGAKGETAEKREAAAEGGKVATTSGGDKATGKKAGKKAAGKQSGKKTGAPSTGPRAKGKGSGKGAKTSTKAPPGKGSGAAAKKGAGAPTKRAPAKPATKSQRKGAAQKSRSTTPRSNPSPTTKQSPEIHDPYNMRPDPGNFDRQTAGTGGIKSITFAKDPEGSYGVRIRGELQEGLYRGKGRAPRGKTKAPNYNRSGTFVSNREAGLNSDWENAHLWGPGFGDEAAAGMMKAPKSVNQWYQNEGIEGYARDLRKAAGPGAKVEVDARAVAHDLHGQEWQPKMQVDFLKRAEYNITVTAKGKTSSVRVTIDVAPPPGAKVQISVDPPGAANPADLFDIKKGWINP
jgi:hypothetical protein